MFIIACGNKENINLPLPRIFALMMEPPRIYFLCICEITKCWAYNLTTHVRVFFNSCIDNELKKRE